ncbi:MAG TPA: FHA domain-containing protein [Fimbriimonadales bacterium]|nr:FHA domain-containing protein [Fimbriimonadales bacterium]
MHNDSLNENFSDEVSDEVKESGGEEISEEQEETPRAELYVVREGKETGEVFTLSSPAVIGRFDPSVGPVDIDLSSLPEGVYVSRRHARIELENGKWILSDLGSSNGTFVLEEGGDFRKISEPTILNDGQEIAFGNARFIFRFKKSDMSDMQEKVGD